MNIFPLPIGNIESVVSLTLLILLAYYFYVQKEDK
jgi:hypothetical protein